jgi:hypothetical protein
MQEHPDFHPSHHWNIAALREAAAGGLNWPPPMDYLVGIEVKISYFEKTIATAESIVGKIEAEKTSPSDRRKIRKQGERLLNMGFDRAAILHIIANPVEAGIGSDAWMQASSTALDSSALMRRLIEKQADDLPNVGHWLWSMGAVAGGHEGMRGSGCPEEIHPAPQNPLLQFGGSAVHNRQRMIAGLQRLLATVSSPWHLPDFMSYCVKCQMVHRYRNIVDGIVDCPEATR